MDSIHLPNAIALPTAFGAPGAPLPPGQVVQALVLALIESDVFRLQLPQATVDVRADVALTPGATVTLAVKSGGPSARLVIYSDTATPAPAGAAPSLAGRHPIGEAVIIARAPLSTPTSVQSRISAEPAIARDAPSISPARPVDVPAPRIVTPAQAVSDAVRAAAPRQAGLAPLFADVEHVIGTASALPAPLRAAAAQLLGLRVPFDEQLVASDVKQAFVRSGVLFEPRLAAAQTAPAPDAGMLAPAPASDLKAALLVLRQVLKAWSASPTPPTPTTTAPPELAARASSNGAAIKHLASTLAGAPDESVPSNPPLSSEQATSLARTIGSALTGRDAPSTHPAANTSAGPPPPYRGAALAAQAPAAPSIAPDATPHEAVERLIAQTDGALARQTLLQVASLPDRPDLPRAEASQRWTFEVPFITPQGTAFAQFEVSRDGRIAKSDPEARTWRARFSLDVEPMGPVHALIALSGARASVTLWAERLSTATRLQDSAPLLSEALRAAELEPADFQLRVGAPPAVRHAAPGRFMDRAT